MNERGSGFGAFLFGVGVGAVLGYLFAPEGGVTRAKLSRKIRGLRDLAAGTAQEFGELVETGDEDRAPPSARAALEHRLTEEKTKRRRRGALPAAQEGEGEGDEPVA